jgi:membrane protease YdiL (CAAX protease family)
MGWRTNRPGPAGVLREIGAGVLGYLTALPIMFGCAILYMVSWFILQKVLYGAGAGAAPMPKPHNKVEDIVENAGPLLLVIVFLLATVWAPIVEESIFRGALYRHLRRRWPVALAALGSAAVFAGLHSYAALQIFAVGALGLAFALVREWRGSIIPTATAHCIQNTFALSVMMAAAPLMRP